MFSALVSTMTSAREAIRASSKNISYESPSGRTAAAGIGGLDLQILFHHRLSRRRFGGSGCRLAKEYWAERSGGGKLQSFGQEFLSDSGLQCRSPARLNPIVIHAEFGNERPAAKAPLGNSVNDLPAYPPGFKNSPSIPARGPNNGIQGEING